MPRVGARSPGLPTCLRPRTFRWPARGPCSPPPGGWPPSPATGAARTRNTRRRR